MGKIIVSLFLLSIVPGWTTAASSPIEALESERIENLFRFSERLYSGGVPVGEEAFAALNAMGIKTVISVDGATPDVAAAEDAGMNYIHLPITYRTIPEATAHNLAKAIRDATAPIYIHCHHGKHRGPTAGALAMVLLGHWTPEAAILAMKTARTSEHYSGLYQCVQEAEVIDSSVLDSMPFDFPSVAPVEPMVAMMVRIQRHYDNLKLAKAAGWKQPPDHPDIKPSHEALLMKEALFELERNKGEDDYDNVFWAMMKANERAAKSLEEALREREIHSVLSADPEGEQELILTITKRMDTVSQTCTACHQAYRHLPLE